MENSLSKYIILTEENKEVIRFKRIRFSWSLGGQYLLMTLS